MIVITHITVSFIIDGSFQNTQEQRKGKTGLLHGENCGEKPEDHGLLIKDSGFAITSNKLYYLSYIYIISVAAGKYKFYNRKNMYFQIVILEIRFLFIILI